MTPSSPDILPPQVAPTDLDTLLSQMTPIGLDEMDSIRLMNRIDTKFLTDRGTLLEVLEKAVAEGFRVFEISGQRIQGYRSMYFDTPELQMYLDHHNRRLTRQKVRTRLYESSGQAFLELKNKDNHGRTKKKRIEIAPEAYTSAPTSTSAPTGSSAPTSTSAPTDSGAPTSTNAPTSGSEARDWLAGRLRYPLEGLSPALETIFSRITLVNPEKTERSTIDFDLHFRNRRTGADADLGDLAILELKQDASQPSKLREILLECRVKPFRISKYCIGTALTDSEVRAGRFKPKLLRINKMKTI